MKQVLLLILFFLVITSCQSQMHCIKEDWGYGEYGSISVPKAFSYGYIKNGKREGEWKSYLTKRRRTLLGVATYHNDTLTGFLKYWYPNGNIFKIAEYKNDKLDGFEINFNEAGDFDVIRFYRNGEMKSWLSTESQSRLPVFFILNDSIDGINYRYDTLLNYFKPPK